MDARTIRKLLQCVQTAENRIAMTAALEAFCSEHRTIGRHKGNFLYLQPSDKETLRQILRSAGIDPDTPLDAWEGKTRAQALALGHNEKLSGGNVKRRRVALKAVHPSDAIDLGGGPIQLPQRCHVDADFERISVAEHDWIVVVENWESFLDVHVASERLEFPGRSPLVVWRGDAFEIRSDAMLAWLRTLEQPVAAFVDYDPAGLVIAAKLPRLERIVSPQPDELARMLKKGIRERFLAQLPGCQRTLDALTHPAIRPLWQLIRAEGKALPQEWFIVRTAGER